MKALSLLRDNVRGLLQEQHLLQKDLAQWCHKTETWISQILNGERNPQIADFDAIADFFHISTYQLFQPGIAKQTERRSGRDRRSGRERRIGHKPRQLVVLDAEVQSAHPRRQQEEVFTLTSTERQLVERVRHLEPHQVETILGIFDAATRSTPLPMQAPKRSRQRPKTKG